MVQKNECERENYYRVLGRLGGVRVWKYVCRDYVRFSSKVDNVEKWKVFISRSNGSGKYGEKLSKIEIAGPGDIHTDSFISSGNFETQQEAENLRKYLKTKFARALLGILKSTQDLRPDCMALIPDQDFSSSSDIDWTQSIPDIDRQLYAKYGLNDKEIGFIENNVKEVA